MTKTKPPVWYTISFVLFSLVWASIVLFYLYLAVDSDVGQFGIILGTARVILVFLAPILLVMSLKKSKKSFAVAFTVSVILMMLIQFVVNPHIDVPISLYFYIVWGIFNIVAFWIVWEKI